MGSHRKSPLVKYIFCISTSLALFFAAIAVSFVALSPNPHELKVNADRTTTVTSYESRYSSPVFSDSPSLVLLPGRPLFPYSIIPGGVESSEELTKIIGNDPVVARHYANFSAARARIVVLDREMQAYVSYRIGQEIFWSKRTLTLHKGETMLTDGEQAVRTRCGNRVSVTPQLPVSSQEPMREALERVETPEIASGLSAPNLSLSERLLPNLVQIENQFGTTKGEGFVSSIIPPGSWGLNSPPIIPIGPPSSPPSRPPVAPQPPVATPEPGTALLLFAGLLTSWLIGKAGEHRQTRNAGSALTLLAKP